MPQKHIASLSNAEKIMVTLHELGKGTGLKLKYEDIVVAVFKKYPEDFHLRGYPEYPDSGDLIHKPLYEFRKKGYLEANSKVFSLTERGIKYTEQLIALARGKNLKSDGRLSRFAEKEISRIESSESFGLFLNDQGGSITETDFYGYLAVTPRTSRNDFLGRLNTVESAIEELKQQRTLNAQRVSIPLYHTFMVGNFATIITHFVKNQ